MYTPTDIHRPIVGMIYTILTYTSTDINTSTLGPKGPQRPINFNYFQIVGRIYPIPINISKSHRSPIVGNISFMTYL